MELERLELPPTGAPKKAKRTQKPRHVTQKLVVVIDHIASRLVIERDGSDVRINIPDTRGSVEDTGVRKKQSVLSSIFSGGRMTTGLMVAGGGLIVLMVLGGSFVKPEAIKTATAFFSEIGQLIRIVPKS